MIRVIALMILSAGAAFAQTPDGTASDTLRTGITRPGEESAAGGLKVDMAPGNTAVRFRFRLDRPVDVRLDIFNTSGKMVHCGLYRYIRSGDKSILWQGLDMEHVHGGTGYYIYSFVANGQTRTGNFLLVH